MRIGVKTLNKNDDWYKDKINLKKNSELILEITDRCPQKCLICSSKASIDLDNILSLKFIEDTLEGAKKLNFESIHLSGGEPLIHPNIIEILNLIKKKEFNTVIYTCGIILRKNELISISDGLIENFKHMKNLTIRFNFQSVKKENFEKITGLKNSFAIANNSLKKIQNNNIKTEVHLVPTKLNYDTIIETIDYLLGLNIEKIKILRFVAQGRGAINRKILELNKKESDKLLNKIKAKYSNNKVEIGSAFGQLTNSFHCCTANLRKLAITPYYTLHPCVAFKKTYGINIKNSGLLAGIKSSNFENDLKRIKEKCQSCIYSTVCTEMCPIQILKCDKYKTSRKNKENNKGIIELKTSISYIN